jgi:hypothetical protein
MKTRPVRDAHQTKHCVQWRTGQGVSLPDGKCAPLNIRQYVEHVNDVLAAWKYNRSFNIIAVCNYVYCQ